VNSFAVPDGIEPIVGWRYWRADEGWLCSLNKFKTWPPHRNLRAQCSRELDHGPLPEQQCGCGIYAAIDLPTLKELVQPDLATPLVVGEVSLWGKVIPAALGFRAELGYPRRIWLVAESVTAATPAAALAASIAARYGVAVGSCDAAWAVSEEQRNPWALEPRAAEIRTAVHAFRQDVERLAAALQEGEDAYRQELARIRAEMSAGDRTAAIVRSAFESSFGQDRGGRDG